MLNENKADVRGEDFEERTGDIEERMYYIESSIKNALDAGVSKGEITKMISDIFDEREAAPPTVHPTLQEIFKGNPFLPFNV